MKPLNLWQRICEHHHVTHIVDFTPGSGALAIAAAGAMEYEGLAANEVHRERLDSTLDRCVLYVSGKDKKFTENLGGDSALPGGTECSQNVAFHVFVSIWSQRF